MPGDHVEVLREGTVGGKARTLLDANHMPRAVEVAGQYARVRSPRRARVPGEDLELVSLTLAALICMKSRTRRPTGRLIHGIGSRFTICEMVRNESGVPACRAGLLGAPGVTPVPIIFAVGRKSLINAEPQRAVDWAKASKRAVGI